MELSFHNWSTSYLRTKIEAKKDMHTLLWTDSIKRFLTCSICPSSTTMQVPYQMRIDLVSLTQQAKLGCFEKVEAELPPLGTFDIIGKERRAAWEALGDLDRDEAKAQFVAKLLIAAPQFDDFIAVKTEDRRREEVRKAEEEKKSKEEAMAKALREEERADRNR